MRIEEIEVGIAENGAIILPPELARRYGLSRGTKIRIEPSHNGLYLLQPVHHLARVYIEPTNRCNLECLTCMRHVWDEQPNDMSSTTFSHILNGLRECAIPPDIIFGGLGEPLAHPDIVEMVRQAKVLGVSVELITNGTLMKRSLARQLIDSGLDRLWVSLDGSTPESFSDVRLGAELNNVLANLAEFRKARWDRYAPAYLDYHLKPELAIIFVAMKRNIGDLPEVMHLGSRLGARRFMVTNVLPYTEEMHSEILYLRALDDVLYASPLEGPSVELPKMDINPATMRALHGVILGGYAVKFAGGSLGERSNRCPFIEKGATAIRWDGDMSPCLPLLHSHRTYLNRFQRAMQCHTVGNVSGARILDLWNLPEYVSFRERVQRFDFSPCTMCGGCELLESNEEDCIGSPFPACGGCLWAQGVIQCP